MRQKYKNQKEYGQNKNKNDISNGVGIYSKPNITSYKLKAKEEKNIKITSINSNKDNSEQINKVSNTKKFGQNANNYNFQDKKDKVDIKGNQKYGDALKNRKEENQDKNLVNSNINSYNKRYSYKNNIPIKKDDNNKLKIGKGNQEKKGNEILSEIKSSNNDKKNTINTKNDNNELEKKIKSKLNNNERLNKKQDESFKKFGSKHNVEIKNDDNSQQKQLKGKVNNNEKKINNPKNPDKKEDKVANNDISKEFENASIKNYQNKIKYQVKDGRVLKEDYQKYPNKKEDKEVDNDIPKEIENTNIKNIQTEIKNIIKKDDDLKIDSKNNSNKKEDKEVDNDIPKEIESTNIKNIQTEIKNKSKKVDAPQVNNLFNFKKISNPVKIKNDNNLNPIQKEDNNENNNEIKKLVPEALKHDKKYKQTRYTSTYNRQIKKTEEINEINSEKSMQELSKPGLIGLKNIGATCYMNATLQCFSNCPRFKNNLLKLYKELESGKDSKYKISFALAEVLKNLWGILHHKCYAPENFKNIISELNPTFRGVAANDPKDLVLFIIQRIHIELNKEDPTIKTNNNDNSYDFWAEYISFMNFYKRYNNSIITEEFHFYTNDLSICSFCNKTINNVQTNNILFFPLEEVRKFKGYFTNYVSIYDCFEYNERQTSSSFHCNTCNNDSIAYSMTKIALSAKTLIINLNRGHGMEYNVNIVFEEYLNIRKFVYIKESPYYYELTGVICHFGSNDDGGHFIAYCKNCDDCNWYKFNDGIINKCSFSDVCQKGMHYVLFYSYIQMED